MAKKIRFPLQMNGAYVRTIEELRENFDLESVLGYFINGKLVIWLRNRYYDNEADAIETLNIDDAELNKKIISILGISFDVSTKEVDAKTIQRRNEKIMLLRQITNDKDIINNIDRIAFNQIDLQDFLKNEYDVIYLCENEFNIPVSGRNLTFIGINNPKVIFETHDNSNIDSLNMKFVNIDNFETSDENVQYLLGKYYADGTGTEQSWEKAVEWYRKSAEQGLAKAQYNLGLCYANGNGVEKSYEKSVEWYRKSAEQGDACAQCNLGFRYYYGMGVEKNYKKAVEWYRKSAEQGNADAQYNLGLCYEYGRGISKSRQEAIRLYQLAARQGDKTSRSILKGLGETW